MKKLIRIINTLIITVGCAFFLLACNDIFDFRTPKESEAEVGTFSLVIEKEGPSRTILPPPNTLGTGADYYTLVFSSSGKSDVSVDRGTTDLTDPVTLAVGTWKLVLTAYKDSDRLLPVAQGTLNTITINANTNTPESLELKPIPDAGTGTFSWNITIIPTVTTASMTITPYSGVGSSIPIDLKTNPNGTQSLSAGYYKVVFSLSNSTGSASMLEVLHIYRNMTSGPFTYTFTNEHFTGSSGIVAVTGITGVPTAGTVGTGLTLSGAVAPSDATNKTITWSVKTDGGTGASISGTTLTATAAGTVTVTATITNGLAQGTDYTQDFSITFIVPVTGITGVPTAGTVGTGLTLSGVVAPSNATNKTITWSVKTDGGTGASISGTTLTATAAGTVTVTATITNGLAQGTDYTQDFSITFIVPVTGITGVPSTGTVGTGLTLSGVVAPSNATNKTITWSVKTDGGTGASISGTTLTATAAGTVTVTATITNGLAQGTDYTQDFNIVFSAAPATGTATITITFADLDEGPSPIEEPITGLALYRTGTPDSGDLEYTESYDTISWSIGITEIGTSGTCHLDANDPAFSVDGTYIVTVIVTKGVVPYSRTIAFTVED